MWPGYLCFYTPKEKSLYEEQEDDHSADLALWLQDSGRRPAINLNESPEELLKYLEELTGAKLRARQDIPAPDGRLHP